MKSRLALLALLSIACSIALAKIWDVTADDQESTYYGEPAQNQPVNVRPAPHFGYTEGLAAQATGLIVPTPGPALPAGGTMNIGEGRQVQPPIVLPTRRLDADILRDTIAEVRKANPDLTARDVRAVVQKDENAVTIVVECNCNPGSLMAGRIARNITVKYLTFEIDRRYPGYRISAGPETDEIRALIARNGR
jgi:hypothetical protein